MTRFTTPLFLLILLSAPLANVAAGQEPTKAYSRSFSQSFQGLRPDPKDMMLIGPDAARFIRYEADGLQITLPPGYQGKRPEIGFATRFPVRGDFEVTLAFEVLQETPSAEPDLVGARIGLSVILNTPAANMATFSRRAAASRTEFVAWRSASAEPGGQTEADTKVIKTSAKSGRLRFVRDGGALHFYAAEGDDAEFKLLHSTTIRKDDLRSVRFFAATGDRDASVDVRFTRLRIRADAFLPPLSVPVETAPKLAERVEYLFREGIAKYPELRFMGADAKSMASIQPQGLRFHIPAGRKNPGEVGVESKLRLRGDFEITLEYEIHAFPDSTPKLGAGAVLQVSLDTPDAFKARMSRAQRPTGSVFTANYLLRGADGKEEYHGLTAPPANPKSAKGKLRMIRVGKMLVYQIDEGGGFRVIARKEVGFADVIAVQGMCATGWEPVAIEVQFPSLELRASEMPDKIVPLPERVAAVEPAQPTHMEYRLRDGIAKYPTLRYVGPDSETMAVVQPQGLRFNVPAGRPNPNDVGIESQMRLRGDFEITLEYEFVALPKEPPPLGVGAVLQIALDTPDTPKARLDRLHRPADAVFGANVIIKEDFRGLMAAPAEGKYTKGQLRMVRTGNVLSYQVQEGDPDFREIANYEIGPGDVISVQALCATGWQPAPVGVRFTRLDLHSSKGGAAMAVEPAPNVPGAPSTASGRRVAVWIAIGLGSALSLIAILGITVFLWKHAPRTIATNPRTSLSASTQVVAFSCPDCGKRLKVKSDLSGKKIKCPHCGEKVPVAATEQNEE